MSFFEWLGESIYPGSVGNIDRDCEPLFQKPVKRVWLLIIVLLGLVLLGCMIGFIIYYENRIILTLGCFLYLFFCYFATPKPDYSNLGLFGGLIDHPFRISDDINRLLVFLSLVLLPGKLILFALQTIYRIIKKEF